VEAKVEGLLATIDEDTLVKFKPCDVLKEIQSLQLGKACGFDGISNEFFWHLPRRPHVHLSCLFNHCLQIRHFLAPWKEVKITALPTPGKDPEVPQNVNLNSLLSTTGNYLRSRF
jgi:hypothetical protein